MTTTEKTLTSESPWAVQERLMRISGQMPAEGSGKQGPVLLYAALTMEEMAETLVALQSLVVLNAPSRSPVVAQMDDVARETLRDVARSLDSASQTLRWLIKHSAPQDAVFELRTDMPRLKFELVDGMADTLVTLFGMCVASQLPVEQCYAEVQRSNLSKANPVTGLIDKDASGKWIKGEAYTPPNLASLLGED